ILFFYPLRGICERKYTLPREQAVTELPADQGFVIMTRENIQQMLPPGKAIEDCEGSCLVETGKNIAADFICQAQVGSFGGSLTLSAELYETAGNKLISSFNGRGADVNELLEIIKQKSPNFFRVIYKMTRSESKPDTIGVVVYDSIPTAANVVEEKMDTLPAVSNDAERADSSSAVVKDVEKNDSVRTLATNAYDELDKKTDSKVGESIPTNVNQEKKDSGVHWVPLSISAVASVTGIVLAAIGNNKAKEASEKKYSSEAEYKEIHEDTEAGQNLRKVGIGLAIVGAIGVGLSIAF
ncbi:hypothetical protein, partial [uncultured Fibrobacter sp.]|uniref:hypothetical protein n=1 Tax=uncultured Fibrobacter sp. TaxID=261512 RepID=UPI00262F338F